MTKQKYKLCVQCLTFNHSLYIKDTMDGFCMQKTNFPFVCFIIDDASTDGAQSVISAYLHENFFIDEECSYQYETEIAAMKFARHKININCFFVVVFLKKNLFNDLNGYGTKLNLISEWRDTCEYEAMCEGDDYWIDENKLQVQVDFLDYHEDYSICSHRIKKYDQDQNIYYVDRLNSLFSGKNGVDYSNSSKIWLSETSSIVYKIKAREEFEKYPYEKRDSVHVYYLLKNGKGYCFSNIMSVYRQHVGGVFSKQDVNTRLIQGTYLAMKKLYMYEGTNAARRLYYSSYAYTFIKTKGLILFKEKFELKKFLSLFRSILSMCMSKHPLYVPIKR